jgi:hypothetical protein
MAEKAKTTHPHAQAHPHAHAYHSNPFELLRPGYEGAKLNLKVYLLLILALIGVFGGLALVAYLLFKVMPIVAVVLGFAAFIFLMIYIAPIPYRLVLAMARHKKVDFDKVTARDLSLGWKVTWTQLLAGLIIIGGFILLIVPGLIFSVWYRYVPLVVVDEGLTGMAALRRSKQLVANRFWDAAGANTVVSVFGILNVVPILGSLVYLVTSLMLVAVPALRYVQLKALKEHSDGKNIETSKWNYAAIAAAVLISAWSYYNSLHNLQNNSQPQSSGNPYYLETK